MTQQFETLRPLSSSIARARAQSCAQLTLVWVKTRGEMNIPKGRLAHTPSF